MRIAIIPARGGSKGIPKKNIIQLKQKPLISYTIEAAIESGCFDKIYVNTDSSEITEVCKKYGDDITIYPRSPHLAQDKTPILEVLQDFVTTVDLSIESLALLQCTSPLRTSMDIKKAYNLWEKNNPETLVSVVKVPHSMNPHGLYKCENHLLESLHPDAMQVTRRQDKQMFFARNGPAILIVRPRNIISGSLYSKSIIGYEMPFDRSFDIDEPSDLYLIEKLL